ncbi:hypothetical protein KSP40_PGU020940 [Platanthera guangdongensis]|uniref:Uncharacterized protein n=1 Tax=Platanthera guangdongensis TaxID=2320717 RepID=A0ABR2MRZ0_9ASPA
MPPSRYPLPRKTLSSALMRSSRHILAKLSGGHAATPVISCRLLKSHSQPSRVNVKPLINSSRLISLSMKPSYFCSHKPLSSSAPDRKRFEKLQEKLRNLGFESLPQPGQGTRNVCPQVIIALTHSVWHS